MSKYVVNLACMNTTYGARSAQEIWNNASVDVVFQAIVNVNTLGPIVEQEFRASILI